MEIRPYQPDDNEHLLYLERQSERGFPRPFVHFRRRFVDRPELYPQHITLVAVDNGHRVGVTSIVLKDVRIDGDMATIAYSFDTRVLPQYRRTGLGLALVEEKLRWASEQGAVGVYSLIVTTNQASLAMVHKAGYLRICMILYLQFLPQPIFIPLEHEPTCDAEPGEQARINWAYMTHDLFVPNVAQSVHHLDFQRWSYENKDGVYAGISQFNQARVYFQIPADAPWPRSEPEIERWGRNVQLFDVVGFDQPAMLYSVFQRIRDEAVMNNVNRLTWMIDRNEMIPRFVFDEAADQKDYWLMYKSFRDDFKPTWQNLIYLDPRDL